MRLIYVSHPEVVIDPDVPVPDWSLNDLGRQRAEALARRGWRGVPLRVITSPERKARQTAEILASDGPVEVMEATAEVDRSATGYLPHAEHEAHADLLFTHPERSANGWERAVDAQARMIAVLPHVITLGRDTMMVGHGGVGALLWCHLAGRAISRAEDQPGAGCFWEAHWQSGVWHPVHPWRPF